jgi:DNA-binding CsgD family transcriptional regulator
LSFKIVSPDVLADLYDAAIDEACWPQLSGVLSKATGFEAAGVWLVEDGRPTDISVTLPIQESAAPYVAHFHKFDPWLRGIQAAPEGRALIGCEYVDEPTLLKSEFYNDFARHYGLRRPISARLMLAPNKFAIVALERPATGTLIESDEKPRMERLLPHVKRALQLRARNRQIASRNDMRAAALDALAFGAVVCNGAGRVAFCNAAAEELARAGAGIVLGRKNRLGALVPAEGQALALLIHDAASGGAGGALRLTGRDGSTAILVLVTPLPGNLRGELGGGHALVALRPTHDSPAFTSALLGALFGLSPVQAAIALAVFDGGSPEEIAAKRGIAVSTLRSHLAEIFARTGTESQRDLIRLLAMVPPLRAR